jgi:hypothetical protein
MPADPDPARVATVTATVWLPAGVQFRAWTAADCGAVHAMSAAAGWVTGEAYRRERARRFQLWNAVVSLQRAA